MPNVSSFGAQTDNAVVSGTVTDRQMIIPEVPPQGLMSVGPRVTPNFVKPREWNAQTTYHFFDAVRDAAGNAYVATKPVVAAGTPLTDEDFWFLWADPDTRFDDLNETVKTFNQRIESNTNSIAGKAPINHASEASIYGVGNSVNFGHVKLADDGTASDSGSNDGIAATPKTVRDAQSYQGAKRNILMLGNSYTTGYDASTQPCAIMNRVKFAFENVYAIGAAACGFAQYAGHDYDFFTLLKTWYNSNKSLAKSITDIAINSAVGDSFCIKAQANYGTLANSTFNNILQFCSENFPNLKRLRVFLCDSLYKTERHSNDLNVDIGLNDLIRLNNYFNDSINFNSTGDNYYDYDISYCGWPGFNLTSTEYMNNKDNTHPTFKGYIKLSKNWLSAYNGTLNNGIVKSFNYIKLDASDFAEGAYLYLIFTMEQHKINILVSLSGIQESTVLKTPNNWVTVGTAPYVTSTGNNTYITNIQPSINFRINHTGDIQLRGSKIDTDAINRNDVYISYNLSEFI